MTKIIAFSQIVESNGKTIRENNMEIQHKLSVGTQVYSRYMKRSGEIKSLNRDCDGTPLYSVTVEYNLGDDDLIPLRDYFSGNYEKRPDDDE